MAKPEETDATNNLSPAQEALRQLDRHETKGIRRAPVETSPLRVSHVL